jgi:hypothetical protein
MIFAGRPCALRDALGQDVRLFVGGAGAARVARRAGGAGITVCDSVGELRSLLHRAATGLRR